MPQEIWLMVLLDGSRAAGATEVTEQSWRDNYLTGNLYSDYFKQFDSGHYFKVMAGFNAELMKIKGCQRGYG